MIVCDPRMVVKIITIENEELNIVEISNII